MRVASKQLSGLETKLGVSQELLAEWLQVEPEQAVPWQALLMELAGKAQDQLLRERDEVLMRQFQGKVLALREAARKADDIVKEIALLREKEES